MPMFFDSQNLTPEQKSRWDFAIRQYERIQIDNAQRQLKAMSHEEKVMRIGVDEVDLDDKCLDDLVFESLLDMQTLLGGGVGDPKSALFSRLLDGKKPLRVPPPRSFSYPWYRIVEESGVFHVMVEPSLVSFRNPVLSVNDISINQCNWSILSANATAKALMDLQLKVNGGVIPISLIRELEAIYAERPEFVVTFSGIGEYRLHLGRKDGKCLKRYLPRLGGELRSVFDTISFKYNTHIDKVLSVGEHPLIAYDNARVNLPDHDLSLLISHQRENLQEDIALFEQDASLFDSVEYSCDDWFLVKVPEDG
ncbi:hypothetical protein [Neptuniibacter sp. QD37_11]|uniref:hypothetical protein n=1 Tax=Neptuniibacter sp. QD37_11 TaxID=3398209 RepID=UPI0039F5A98C